MGITDDIGDPVYKAGQVADAENLADPGSKVSGKFVPNWVPAFKNPVHGVLIISGDSQISVDRKLAEVEAILRVGKHDATIHEILRTVGVVRPGNQKGHEQSV